MNQLHELASPDEEYFKAALSENMLFLLKISRIYTADRSFSEDLVQDTFLRALANRHRFRSGTDLKRWLATILRNHFFNLVRTRKRNGEVNIDEIENSRSLPSS